MHVYNKKIPTITTEHGTAYRADIVDKHLQSIYHAECEKVERINALVEPDKILTPMDISISKANLSQANYVAKLMIQIFNDAKVLTLAAWNWPGRHIANEASMAFNFEKQTKSVIPDKLSLQYINPIKHNEILKFIVKADLVNLKCKIKDSLAISLRADGSVDRSQQDKIYVMGKCVNKTGDSELLFLGMDEQISRGAKGLLQTVMSAMNNLFSDEFVTNVLIKKISSICTDGTNVNSGEKGGLWTYFEEEMLKAKSYIPLIKIWCVAHRANLSFKDLANKNSNFSKLLDVMSSIASYFNTSSVRSTRLKQIAAEKGIKLLKMPKIFDIRWVEHKHQLVKAILNNWLVLVLYFCENEKEATSNGFNFFLIDADNVRKMSFVCDLLNAFQRFQKQLQCNSLTLPMFCQNVQRFIGVLNDLKVTPILGGFEYQIANQMIWNEEEKLCMHNIELIDERKGRNHSPDLSEFKAVVIDVLTESMKVRLQDEDGHLLSLIESFLNFEKDHDIMEIHSVIGKDLNISNLHLQYIDLANSHDSVKKQSLPQLVKYLVEEKRVEHFTELSIMLARILACTPHSADCERCISANNCLKTHKRSSLLISTENNYLYVHFNMPTLEKFNPRAAGEQFISDVNRRNSNKSTSSIATTSQPYFNHIFENTILPKENIFNDEYEEEDYI